MTMQTPLPYEGATKVVRTLGGVAGLIGFAAIACAQSMKGQSVKGQELLCLWIGMIACAFSAVLTLAALGMRVAARLRRRG
jgi:hypothetical protein